MFPEDIDERILEAWRNEGLIIDDVRGQLSFDKENCQEDDTLRRAEKFWWELRTVKVELVDYSDNVNMFGHVEHLVHNMSRVGPSVFSLYQCLLGICMGDPIFGI
jgi:hypothetical protein